MSFSLFSQGDFLGEVLHKVAMIQMIKQLYKGVPPTDTTAVAIYTKQVQLKVEVD